MSILDELDALETGKAEQYDERQEDVTLPTRIYGSQLLVRMIGELQEELVKKKSTIILSENVLARSAAGSVIAEILVIGDNAFDSPRYVYFNGPHQRDKYKVGDKVLIKRMSGTTVPGSKGTFQTIDDDAIMAVY